MLTSPECQPLLQNNPDVNRVFTADPTNGAGRLERGTTLLRTLREVRSGCRATAIILHRHRAFAGLCRLAGFECIAGFADRWNPALTHSVAFDLNRHRLERQQDLLRTIGILTPVHHMRLVLTPSERSRGEAVWRDAGADSARLVLAPGGGTNRWSEMPNRRWPAGSFRKLAQWSHTAGIPVQVVGGDSDRDLAEGIAGDLPGVSAAGAGRWSVRETAAVIATARLVVTNDSLPLFLAAALGSSVLGLYGPTDHRLIHPFASGRAIQGNVGCGPCYIPTHGAGGLAYRCPRARCMESISAEQIWPLVIAELRHPPSFRAAPALTTGTFSPLRIYP